MWFLSKDTLRQIKYPTSGPDGAVKFRLNLTA
jgi:hypothetical protein